MLTGFSRASCTDAARRPAGPPAPGRRRTYPARTALSCRGLRYDHHRLREKYVLAGERSPRSVCLPAVIRSQLRSGATRTGFGSCGMCPPTPPPGTPGGPTVPMMLTSVPHRRCAPTRNRRIPTFPLGLLDVGLLDVSAVDTGPATYLSCEDCAFLQRTALRPPPFAGEVRPGGRTQSPIRLTVSRDPQPAPVRCERHDGWRCPWC